MPIKESAVKRMRKAQYVLGIDFSSEEQRRLKRFAGAMGYKSIRVFVREAILEKIHSDMNAMPDQQMREAVETILDGGLA